MAVSSQCCPLLFTLSLLYTSSSAFLHDWDPTSAPVEPHFTECLSRDLATFRCVWSSGTDHNQTEALRVYYLKKDKNLSINEWKECPQYDPATRECTFDANHTVIWVPYCLQLRGANVTYFNEDDCFTVENIVRPDPPVSLNWTLLNVSPSGRSYDVLLDWDHPPSAGVETGWMRLEYELQYREVDTPKWEVLEIQPLTQQTIFGLNIGREYEAHVRCRMQAFSKFGQFSESIYIETTAPTDDDSSVPLMMALIFGVSGVVIMLMFIVLSQQHRLMMILLPPVPAPKIKGIDSELLKKGKLEELNLILSSGLDILPPHAPDGYHDDEPWVEFIEVDARADERGEREERSDKQRLLDLPQTTGPYRHTGCANTVSFPDDDSGRASCYDSDHPDQDTLLHPGVPLLHPGAPLLPGQPEYNTEPSYDRAPICTQTVSPQTWVNTDFYAQVSNVMPSGGVVLSPGQHVKTPEEESKKGSKGEDLHFQLMVVDTDTAENKTNNNTDEPEPSAVPPQEPQSAYILTPETPLVFSRVADFSPVADFRPVVDYTMVQEVDSQHSLLLNPSPSLTSCLPPQLLKALPAMPAIPPMPLGYVTPDLMGNLSQ